METAVADKPNVKTETARLDLPLLGMHCAACANRIEKALNKAEGVESCNVNFATTRATVQYDAAINKSETVARSGAKTPVTMRFCRMKMRA